MLGASFAFLITQAKSFLERQVIIYGLMLIAALFCIFAAGYGLDALREVLFVRVGGVIASAILGGILLVLSLGCFVTAFYLSRSPRTSHPTSSSDDSPRRGPLVSGSAMLAGGAITGLVAAVLAAKRPKRGGRTFFDREHVRRGSLR
jgi:hypothetical protein